MNDGNMVLWRGLGVSSWPTLAVVSPQGKLIGMLPGEQRGPQHTAQAAVVAGCLQSASVPERTWHAWMALSRCHTVPPTPLLDGELAALRSMRALIQSCAPDPAMLSWMHLLV